MIGIRDRYFHNPDESKTFVPTKEYSGFHVHKNQAVFDAANSAGPGLSHQGVCLCWLCRLRLLHLEDTQLFTLTPLPTPIWLQR